MSQTIPILAGASNSHQVLSVQLGDHFLEIRLDWVTRAGFWKVDVLEAGQPILQGRVLAPPVDLFYGLALNTSYGRLLFVGDDPTLDNLGTSNALIWVANG